MFDLSYKRYESRHQSAGFRVVILSHKTRDDIHTSVLVVLESLRLFCLPEIRVETPGHLTTRGLSPHTYGPHVFS